MAVTNIGDDGPDGMQIGAKAGSATVPSKVGFFGKAPVAQRTGTAFGQATSQLSLTTFATINTNIAAFNLEVANTFIGLGIWSGA